LARKGEKRIRIGGLAKRMAVWGWGIPAFHCTRGPQFRRSIWINRGKEVASIWALQDITDRFYLSDLLAKTYDGRTVVLFLAALIPSAAASLLEILKLC